MPEGANDIRAEQTATLSVIAHELATDPRMADLLAEAESDTSLDAWQRANLREMRRHHIQATAIPADLVEATSKAVSVCEMTWRAARAESDFAKLLPSLTEVLARVVADRLVERIAAGGLGVETQHLREIEVVLRESDVAWAGYHREVAP